MNSYAGIGSRATPQEVLYQMTEIAKYMESFGWTLRSGGARGADTAFESGCEKKEIYLPWKGFNGHQSKEYLIGNKAKTIAKKVWDRRYQESNVPIPWERLSATTKLFMARDCYQILGKNLDDPSKLVIAWTIGGEAKGGTGQALYLAKMVSESMKIPTKIKILNLQKEAHRTTINNMIKTRMNPIILYDV